jgi:hypothetical protein
MPLVQVKVIEVAFTYAHRFSNPDLGNQRKIDCRPSLDDPLAFTSKGKKGAS